MRAFGDWPVTVSNNYMLRSVLAFVCWLVCNMYVARACASCYPTDTFLLCCSRLPPPVSVCLCACVRDRLTDCGDR